MFLFTIDFKPGIPASEQIVYAVKKATVAGMLKPGDRFPSVRALSQELRINPNTAHKAVSLLVSGGLLEVHPGVGTVVSKLPPPTAGERSALLGAEAERLVVEAKKLRLSLDEVQAAVAAHWKRLS